MTESSVLSEQLKQPGILALQRKTIGILVMGQVLAGLGFGAALSVGALLAARVSGDPSWSGMASTMTTLGAALTAYPLARLANRGGRRISLSTGSLIAGIGVVLVLLSAFSVQFWLLLIGLGLMGAGTAVQFQSRFAAADLAPPETRGRALSIVVWSTTIGSVIGPNLLTPGEALGSYLGMPKLTGAFLITLVAQALVTVLYLVALRPDPLLTSQKISRTIEDARSSSSQNSSGSASSREAQASEKLAGEKLAEEDRRTRISRQRMAILIMALAHAVMVSVMAMTPVHLTSHGASLQIVGLTLSLHIAGMFFFAPLWGILSDRIGASRVVLMGAVISAISLIFTATAGDDHLFVQIGLILLGLGWSASTVAGAAMLAQNKIIGEGAARQGISDAIMSGAGALAGATSGLILGVIGFSGLSLVSLITVALIGAAAVLTQRMGPLSVK